MHQVIATSHQSANDDIVFIQRSGAREQEVSQATAVLAVRANAVVHRDAAGYRLTLRRGEGPAFVRALQLLVGHQSPAGSVFA